MSDKPCLLMLPGLDGTGELFAPLAGHLEEHFELVIGRYPDLPDFESYVEHAASLLPAGRPVALLAESFSGPVAIALMARHRARIEAAILSATFAISPRPLLTRLASLRPATWFTNPALRRFTVELFGLNGADCPEARGLVMRITANSEARILLRRAAILHRTDVRALLPAIDIPVLCLRAGRDRVVPARQIEILREGLANAQLAEIDAPHMLLQCRARQSAERILRFLARSSRERRAD